jgi:hypothetical protein
LPHQSTYGQSQMGQQSPAYQQELSQQHATQHTDSSAQPELEVATEQPTYEDQTAQPQQEYSTEPRPTQEFPTAQPQQEVPTGQPQQEVPTAQSQSQTRKQSKASTRGPVVDVIKLGEDVRRNTKTGVRDAIRRANEFGGRPLKGPTTKIPPLVPVRTSEPGEQKHGSMVTNERPCTSDILNQQSSSCQPTTDTISKTTRMEIRPEYTQDKGKDVPCTSEQPSAGVEKIEDSTHEREARKAKEEKLHEDLVRILGPPPKKMRNDPEFEDMWDTLFPHRNQQFDPDCLGDVIDAHSWATLWGRRW